MGKTKLFGRPTSKISHKTSLAEENQFVERFRTPDPGPESRNGHKQSGGHKYLEEKIDKRRQVDKAKKLSEKTSLSEARIQGIIIFCFYMMYISRYLPFLCFCKYAGPGEPHGTLEQFPVLFELLMSKSCKISRCFCLFEHLK